MRTCKRRVGQNRMYAPCMTVYLVISLPKIPYTYTHRICMVLANPIHRYGSGQPRCHYTGGGVCVCVCVCVPQVMQSGGVVCVCVYLHSVFLCTKACGTQRTHTGSAHRVCMKEMMCVYSLACSAQYVCVRCTCMCGCGCGCAICISNAVPQLCRHCACASRQSYAPAGVYTPLTLLLTHTHT
jgi:hypothetical protein